jgi:hypothetical protein
MKYSKPPVHFALRWLIIWLPTILLLAGFTAYALYDYYWVTKPFYDRLRLEKNLNQEEMDTVVVQNISSSQEIPMSGTVSVKKLEFDDADAKESVDNSAQKE